MIQSAIVETTDVIDFLIHHEGVRLKSYYDGYANGSNRYSIGYGTISQRNQRITMTEAKRRFRLYLNPLIHLVDNNCYTSNQKKAMVSYMYNTGGFQMNLRKYIKRCSIRDIRYIMSVYGWNKVLIKRRKAELRLFNK